MKRRKQHKTKRMKTLDISAENHDHNQRQNEDTKYTLSDFPDCVLIHILSFLNSKDAVRTCILSSRWEHLWKNLTALTLSSSYFNTVKGFMKFVNGILSLRDYSMPLNALDFECQGHVVSHELERIVSHTLERIIRYAASHDVNCLRLSYKNGRFPHSLLSSCQSLTSLDIGNYDREEEFPNSLNLPSLTYLKLHHFSFNKGNDGCVEPFSTFNRLDTLILYSCTSLWYSKQPPLCISSTTLLNLSIHLGNASLEMGFSNIELFAPSLCTFDLTCNSFPKLSGSHLSSIKQVSIDVLDVTHPLGSTLNWLIEMTNIKSLTVTPTTLQALSLVPDILKLKHICLCNLKSLNLKFDSKRFSLATHWRDIKLEVAYDKSWKENAKLREKIKAGLEPIYSSILDGMIEFLLQNSPSSNVDILLES